MTGQWRKHPALIVALLAGLAGMTSCSSSPPAASPSTTQAAAPPAATRPPADSGFTASGPIVVENQVDVAAERDGVVAHIQADTGALVRRGQLLARLDDRQITADHDAAAAKARSIQADVKNWEAEVKVVQSDQERAEKMWEAQLITKEDLDHARYKVVASQYEVEREKENLKNAQAAADSLALELEKTRIKAPFDGVVARRYVREGQKVAQGDRLFWVTATGTLRVKFALPERFLGSIKKGDEVSVTAAEVASGTHSAKVILVSPVVDPSSGTIDVTAQLEGPGGELRPGMTATVRLPSPH